MSSDVAPDQSIVYRNVDGTQLTLDVFQPTGDPTGAAVIVFHGGAWRYGSPAEVHERAAALAARGYVAFAAQYRLLDTAQWPAQRDDAAAALAWVREHAAEFGLDPERIVVQGHSAGAHLALLMGTLERDLRPAAILAYYPPIGFHSCAEPDAGGKA